MRRTGSLNARALALSPEQRVRDLVRAQNERFDVVVIGGGVTGCGAALDAASRGLRVCLVEKRDFAAGTSSRSSKLIHGGLRYLEQRDFTLVREALGERRVLLEQVAPHLVRPAPFLLPLRHHYERPYIGAGVALYDVLAGPRPGVPRHRHLSHAACLRAVPSLDPKALVGGIQYWDAQIDDARHTAVLARTAATLGAVCLTGVAMTGLTKTDGRFDGVEVVDVDSPETERFRIAASVVVNATGVWSTAIERQAGITNPIQVRAAKGIHVVVPRARVDASTAMIMRTDRSVLFLIPWGDRWVIGTTDTDWSYDLDHPSASAADVDYVLGQVNQVLREDLTTDDVVGVYAGLRPLVSGNQTSTTKLSREHAINEPAPGLFTIAGGKYTSYRLMAEDVIDRVAESLTISVPKSRTDRLPLVGAESIPDVGRLRAHRGATGLSQPTLGHLIARYGSSASEVLDLVEGDSSLRAVVGGDSSRATVTSLDPTRFDSAHTDLGNGRHLGAEILHSVLCEGARHLDDVLTRRTRLSIEADDRGVGSAAAVAAIMAPALGWSTKHIETEIRRYADRVDAEQAAQREPDDRASAEQRAASCDIRVERLRAVIAP